MFIIEAFQWGRRTAHDAKAVEVILGPAVKDAEPETLDQMIARRVAFLTDYQNAAYAKRYRDLVERVRMAEMEKAPGETGLSEAVAKYLFKLMA